VVLSWRRMLALAIAVATVAVVVGSTITWGYSSRLYAEFSTELLAFGEGFVNVVVHSPRRWLTYSFTVSEVAGRGVELDVGDVVRDFLEYYRSLPRGYEGPVLVPSVSVTMFFYRGSVECVASYVYTTRDYFMERGLDEVEASKKALENPMALFESRLFAKPSIRFRLRMPAGGLEPACVDFTPAIRDFINELGGSSELETLDKSATLLGVGWEMDLPPVPVAEAQAMAGGCKLYGTSVVYDSLYSERDSPPQGWYTSMYFSPTLESYLRAYGLDPHGVRRAIWRWFAEYFSKAYYWEATPNCTFTGAVQATVDLIYRSTGGTDTLYRFLSAPAIKDVDEWVANAVSAFTGISLTLTRAHVNWLDCKDLQKLPYVDVTREVPYLGIGVYNPYLKPVVVWGDMAVSSFRKVHRGLSFMGIIVWGEAYEQPLTIISRSAVCEPTTSCEGYVTFRTTFRYVGDRVVTLYDVSEVVMGGRRYWAVTPVATPIPGAYVLVDYASARYTTSVDGGLLSELTYGAGRVITTISRSNIPPITMLYHETSGDRVTVEQGDKYMALGTNVLLALVQYTISVLAPKSSLALEAPQLQLHVVSVSDIE